MGARTAFAGRLGSDESSRFVESSLQKCGVATHDVVRCQVARPGSSTILIDPSAGTRAVLSEVLGLRGADDALPPAELIRQSRVLCLDGHGVTGSIRAAKIARESGHAVVGDFERVHEGQFDILLALVDHLIVPEAFAKARTGCTDATRASAALLDAERAAVVVTCGDRGGVYCVAGCIPTHYPAVSVAAQDTTGCGDVFHGVYAAGLAFGWDIAKRVHYAATAAALKAASGSDLDAIPHRTRIEQCMHASRP
jgi:ribokinase